MKTPLPSDDRTLPALLASGWGVEVAVKPQFLPLGDSAYSYRVEAVTDEHYYLKVVDRSTVRGRQTAERMRTFSLQRQRAVAQLELEEIGAPLPYLTSGGSLAQESGRLLLALYSFIEGKTLADAYPMPEELVGRIGRALGRLHAVQLPEPVGGKRVGDTHLITFDEQLRADLATISGISARASTWKQQLRELVVPRLEMIVQFMAGAVLEGMRICHYILERDVATVISWRSFTPDGTHGGQVFIGDRASFVKGHTQCFVLRFGPTDANPHD